MIKRNNLSSYIHKWVSIPNPIILWKMLYGFCQLSVSGLKQTNKKLNNTVKDLIKRLLNDAVINDIGWLVNKKVKQEPNLWSGSIVDCIVEALALFFISTTSLMARWPYLWGSGQVFQLMEPIKVLNQKHSQSATIGSSKKAKKNWACLHQLSNRQTRIAVVHEIIFSTMHKTIFLAVRIKPTKAVTFLWVNIKPTRPTTSTFKVYQEVYKVSQKHQEDAVYLTAQSSQ